MSISGVGQNFYRNNVETIKNANSTEKFALEKTGNTKKFFKKTSEKKDNQKELLEEYLEKRAQAKRQQQELLDEKIAKSEQERSRLAKAWSSKQQMAAASNAYDANVMTETAAGGDTLLG